MEKLNILIVDDEQPARRKIRSFLKNDFIESVTEAENGIEAVKAIREKQPDLVFLDIQMSGMNGFEVIENVGAENMPVVIFVTAYDQYALNAFDVQAIDYLLKPFDQDRFEKSFRRALKQIELRKGSTDGYQKLIDEIKKDKKYLERILVNIGPRYFFVKTVDILYISAEEKYVRLHTEKETHLVRETMNHMEQQLDPSRFTRIHRSTIINTDFIREFQPWSHGDYIAILKNGQKLTISRRYRGRLFSRS